MNQDNIFNQSSPRGEHRDVYIGANNTIIWKTPWQHNVITSGLRPLIAALIKGDDQPTLSFWAVGTGDAAWDQGTPPTDEERKSRTQLYNEVARKPFETITKREDHDNQLEIKAIFTISDITDSANNQLREFGIFAGGTENTPNSGILINHRLHPRIDLEAGADLVRTLRLIF